MEVFIVKFFNQKIIDQMSSDEYTCLINDYNMEFQKTKKYLPENFVLFLSKHGLHDALISDINIRKIHSKKRVKFYIDIKMKTPTGLQFNIEYQDVVKFKMNFSIENEYGEVGDYTIGELLISDDHYLTHEFNIYEHSNTFFIKFKKLDFRFI